MITDVQLQQMSGLDALAAEFGGELGDKRRSNRARACGVAIAGNPDKSFPRIFTDHKALEAFYRLAENDAIPWRAMTKPHVDRTIERAVVAGDVVVAHDTSDMVFRRYWTDDMRKNLSRLTSRRQGMHVHASLVAAADGLRIPLGVSHLQPFVHGVGLEDSDTDAQTFWKQEDGLYNNEMQRWFDGVCKTGDALKAAGVDPVHVMDREADTFGLLSWMRSNGHQFVIRCQPHRRLGRATLHGTDKKLGTLPLLGEVKVALGERFELRVAKMKTRHPPRRKREAILQVRAATIDVPRARKESQGSWSPQPWSERPPLLTLNLVELVEPNPPEGEAPVRWLLLTDQPIETPDDVLRVVDLYCRRWLIEEFFKCLKSGCQLEERQMESAANLLRVLSLLLPVAWRLLLLRALAEAAPETSWTCVLEPLEFDVLRRIYNNVILGPEATTGEVLAAIASLGGHLKRNGRPGWQVLLRGWARLNDYVIGARLFAPTG